MNILVITETLFPNLGNNGNLIGKLIPYLEKKHHVEILSMAFKQTDSMPNTVFGVPAHWARDEKRNWKRKILYPAVSKLVDRNGYSDAVSSIVLAEEIKRLDAEQNYDVLITMSEPFVSALSALLISNKKRILYIMDPPAQICGGKSTAFRDKMLPEMVQRQDFVLTTPFILEALKKNHISLPKKIETVGFPVVTSHMMWRSCSVKDKIKLLFCGWLYSDIRSPRFFLDIVSRLDERFEVTFMGRECETLLERFTIETKAKIVTLPHQAYETALKAMANADILINIGNSIPVHMPSKTLEYINTGKPMVNFYKLLDCPTLYYTRRYPLCLNLYESEKNIEKITREFISFCLNQKGKMLNHTWIEKEYVDCTPQYIAQKILDFLEK